MNKILDSPTSRDTIRKKLLLGEVLNEQLKENFSTLETDKEKILFRRMISGRLVKKYGIFKEEKHMKPFKGNIYEQKSHLFMFHIKYFKSLFLGIFFLLIYFHLLSLKNKTDRKVKIDNILVTQIIN